MNELQAFEKRLRENEKSPAAIEKYLRDAMCRSSETRMPVPQMACMTMPICAPPAARTRRAYSSRESYSRRAAKAPAGLYEKGRRHHRQRVPLEE